jgi:hypothetical protein
MDDQRVTYQRDKDGNIKRIRVVAENTDILQSVKEVTLR